MKTTVKITVLKREYYQNLADQYLADLQKGPCARVKEGQTFLVSRENYDAFPYETNFCPSAWDVIKDKVYAALQGGQFYWDGWMRGPKKNIVVCCDDGVRPVVFLLERIEESNAGNRAGPSPKGRARLFLFWFCLKAAGAAGIMRVRAGQKPRGLTEQEETGL